MSLQTLAMIGSLRLASFALAALFLALVAFVVPPAVYGHFSLALSVLQVVSLTLFSWPNQAFLRYGREALSARGTLSPALGTRLALHGLLLPPAVLAALLSAPQLAEWIGVPSASFAFAFVIGLVLIPLPDMGAVAAQACGRFNVYGLAPVLQRLVQLAALAAIALGLPASWELLLACTLAGYVITAAMAWADIPRPAIGLAASTAQLRQLISYSWAIPAATLSTFAITWMDLWLIRSFLDADAVGVYAWAYSITLLAANVFVPLAAVTAPRLIDLRIGGDINTVRRLVVGFASVCFVAAALMPAGIGLMAATGGLIPLGAYAAALPPLLVLAVGTLCQMGLAFMDPAIYAHETLVRRLVLVVVAITLAKGALAVLLIPQIGILGAAVATTAAYGFGLAMQWRLVNRHIVPHALQPGPILAIVLLGGALALLGPLYPAATLVLGLVLSLALLWRGRRRGWFAGLQGLPPLPRGERLALWLAGG